MKKNEIVVPGFGGNIVATAITDPEYPGIQIGFEQDGVRTCLALVEQADKKLMLRSYMNAERDEPLSTSYVYDREMLQKTAYEEARKKECFLSYESFCARIKQEEKEIFQFLPRNMWLNYLLARS